jgi:lipopolysaccharide/colanic/teichoic acid biosynthesis glycosyltransferase
MLSTADGIYRPASEIAAHDTRWRPRGTELVLFKPEVRSQALPATRAQRVLNVIVALLGLIVAAPLLFVIAILVKLTSPGPVLFCQKRVGIDRRTPGSGGNWRRTVDYGGKLFTIYKFRTMAASPTVNASDQVWARPDDPRITTVGRVLRKYRLDELPQLVNVLRGEMNIVGPRPEQPNIFLQLREQIDGYQLRQRMLPGITGWAQINQHYDTCTEDVIHKLKYDLEYANQASVAQDLKIMLRTIPVVVFRRGAW